MTAYESIFHHNKNFQICYFDKDVDFFGDAAPRLILSIIQVIGDFRNKFKIIELDSEKIIEKLKTEISELKRIKEVPKVTDQLRDRYLVIAKRNVCEHTWEFYHAIRMYDERYLNEEM